MDSENSQNAFVRLEPDTYEYNGLKQLNMFLDPLIKDLAFSDTQRYLIDGILTMLFLHKKTDTEAWSMLDAQLSIESIDPLKVRKVVTDSQKFVANLKAIYPKSAEEGVYVESAPEQAEIAPVPQAPEPQNISSVLTGRISTNTVVTPVERDHSLDRVLYERKHPETAGAAMPIPQAPSTTSISSIDPYRELPNT